jgi:guanylate kinase
MIANDEFIEQQARNAGAKYGTAHKELERIKATGKIPIIEVDVEGAIEINRQALEGNFLFIYPPSFEELRKRIGNRIETEADFKIRIKEAINQIELANNSVLFTNRLVNDKLEDAKEEFDTLIKALYFQEIQIIRGQKIDSSRQDSQQEPKE